jgi:iron complex outermembrane receptor protein
MNYRAFMELAHYVSSSSAIKFRTAYFDETIEYKAPGILSIANAEIFNYGIDYSNDSGLNLGAFYRKDIVNASFFEPTHVRNTISALADWKILLRKVEIGASIRPEWVNNKLQPLIVGIRLKKDISPSFISSIRYNKGYILPSFNDLYWPTGGNPELKSEKSHELEFGLTYEFNKLNKSKINVDFFMNLIDDWIQWTPVNGTFEPINLRKVRNLGFEIMLTHKLQWSEDKHIKFNLLYSFTDSRLIKNYLNSNNDGKRSIFVPVHKVTGQISWTTHSWRCNLMPLYYSKRYDTVDNSSFASGYFILDFEVVKRFQIRDKYLYLSLAIENGLNNDYENIRFYPMPLRIFRIGLNFKI